MAPSAGTWRVRLRRNWSLTAFRSGRRGSSAGDRGSAGRTGPTDLGDRSDHLLACIPTPSRSVISGAGDWIRRSPRSPSGLPDPGLLATTTRGVKAPLTGGLRPTLTPLLSFAVPSTCP